MPELSTPDHVRELARYQINAANISDSIEVTSCLQNSMNDPEVLLNTLNTVFGEKERLQCGSVQTRNRRAAPRFDISVLNTDHDPSDICEAVKGFSWTVDGRKGAGCASMLFWGPPGTGKTAFAEHMAETLSLELMEKHASDLVSAWVGQTEKNIREAFEEAANAEAILLLDEADSFLRNREKATAHYLVTETNELLKQMETFEGILICCTNLLESLDRASLRRFVCKVEFKETRRAHRMRLVEAYFPNVHFAGVQAKQIESTEGITPGDSAFLYNRYQLMGTKEPEGDRLCMDIRSKVAYRKYGDMRGIGFL